MIIWQLLRSGSEIGRVTLDGTTVLTVWPQELPAHLKRVLVNGLWVDREREGSICRSEDLSEPDYWDYKLLRTAGPPYPWDEVRRQPAPEVEDDDREADGRFY